MTRIRIGTRGSRLAMAQTRQAAETIAQRFPHWEIQLVPIQTRGDRYTGPLSEAGGKGLFTAELEESLRSGTLDLAVHSAKDLPAEMAEDLTMAAVLPRADARDVLLSRLGPLDALPKHASVATSSLRRSALLKDIRNDLTVLPLRGNVDTRVKKILSDDTEPQAAVLALAGLERLGLHEAHRDAIHPLPIETFLPAAGQGTLVLQTHTDSCELLRALGELDHAESHQALQAERSVLRALRASCHSCLAVHVLSTDGRWTGRAMVARPDGSDMLRVRAEGASAEDAAKDLAEKLLSAGAETRLRENPPAQ